MPDMIRAVIFDFDGIIVDTMDIHFKTWTMLAQHIGIAIQPEMKSRMKGASRDKSLKVLLADSYTEYTDDQLHHFTVLKDNWYQEEIKQMTKNLLLDGIENFITRLKSSGFKLAVASSSKNAKRILEQINFTEPFDIIIDANNITVTKPSPDVFLRAIELLGVNAKECMVIEDSPLGIKAAKTASCWTIGIGDKELLHEADYTFDNFNEIPMQIFGLPSQ